MIAVAAIGLTPIKNRYHVAAYGNNPTAFGYAVFDKEKITFHSAWKTEEFFKSNKANLIELYEKVCNLGMFDPNHRPVIEAQYYDGKIHFLQYHRARDFVPSTFVLDRPKKNREFEALFVRGSTASPEGMICKTTLCYGKDLYEFNHLPVEDGSFDLHYNWKLINLMAGKRKLQVKPGKDLNWEMMGIAVKHSPASQLFKPQVFVIVKETDFPQLKLDAGLHKLFSQGSTPYMTAARKLADGGIYQFDIKVISDGNRAYLEVMESPLKTELLYAYGYLLEVWKSRHKIPDAIKKEFAKLNKPN